MMPVRTNASTLSIKKKKATISELRVSLVIVGFWGVKSERWKVESNQFSVISGGWDFDAGEFICQQVDFVNQDREALRANVLCLAFEGQV